jgi:hypothetical protein
MFPIYLSQCFSNLRAQKVSHQAATAVLRVLFVSLTFLSSSGFYTAFLVFVLSSDFSTKENVTVNYKVNGQCQEVTGLGGQLPLSSLTVALLPVGDIGGRPCEQMSDGPAVARL